MVQLFKECTRNVNKVIEFFSTTVETEFHYMRIAQRNYKVQQFNESRNIKMLKQHIHDSDHQGISLMNEHLPTQLATSKQ